MLMTHHGTKFTKEDCVVAFLKDIVCSRFVPAAKVELGLLENTIPESVKWRKSWVMPDKYEVQVLAQKVIHNSLKVLTSGEDLSKIERPTFCRLDYEDKETY